MVKKTLGKIVSKYDVRIYVFSPLHHVRPIFHQLFEEIAQSTLPDAFCTLIILSNKIDQYYKIDHFNKANLWRGLKKVRNDEFNPHVAILQLEEDLTINNDCQIFVINSDDRYDLTKLPLARLVTTGVTFITVSGKSTRRLTTGGQAKDE